MRKAILLGLMVLSSFYLQAQDWTVNGNAGLADSNFLGTTTNVPLKFKVNNVLAGKVASNGLVSLGYQALGATPHASSTAIGFQAFANTTTSADWCVAVGYQAGLNTTTGWGNSYLGFRSGYGNGAGSLNVALGTYALSQAGTTGNTSIGSYSLSSLTTGDRNVALGYQAGRGEPYSPGNLASVIDAKCMFLGTYASRDSSISNTIALTNAIAIGYNAKVGASNSLVLGGVDTNVVNVGIGNVAPQNKLEITQGTDGNSGLRFTNLTSASTAGTSSGKVLSVDANGDVVLETAAGGGDGSETVITAGANVSIYGSGTSGDPYIINATSPPAAYWEISPIGSDNIVNNNTGGVVIGSGLTTLPSGYKLYVESGILTEKLKVSLKTSTNWADHVFAKDYRLKPLTEVENFINANKHLPGVPSADALVKDGGIDVTQMLAKQMEKIEELTLYLIEMNKKLEKLEKENAALKNPLPNNQ